MNFNEMSNSLFEFIHLFLYFSRWDPMNEKPSPLSLALNIWQNSPSPTRKWASDSECSFPIKITTSAYLIPFWLHCKSRAPYAQPIKTLTTLYFNHDNITAAVIISQTTIWYQLTLGKIVKQK